MLSAILLSPLLLVALPNVLIFAWAELLTISFLSSPNPIVPKFLIKLLTPACFPVLLTFLGLLYSSNNLVFDGLSGIVGDCSLLFFTAS